MRSNGCCGSPNAGDPRRGPHHLIHRLARSNCARVLGDIAPEADLAALRPDRALRDELDLDSMDILNAVIALHRALGIDIPEADYGHLATLDGAVEYLNISPADWARSPSTPRSPAAHHDHFRHAQGSLARVIAGRGRLPHDGRVVDGRIRVADGEVRLELLALLHVATSSVEVGESCEDEVVEVTPCGVQDDDPSCRVRCHLGFAHVQDESFPIMRKGPLAPILVPSAMSEVTSGVDALPCARDLQEGSRRAWHGDRAELPSPCRGIGTSPAKRSGTSARGRC